MNYNTKYVVRLTLEERKQLESLVRKGRAAAAKRLKPQILLKSDAGPEGSGWTDAQVAEALEVSVGHVHVTRQAYVERGLEATLARKSRGGSAPRKLDGAQEARLIALACGPAPEGRARWTLRLLADKLVELEIIESISKDSVRRTLKKTTLSRG
jgi:transposase